MQTLHCPYAYEHCSPCFLHVHLPVLQLALLLHLTISINYMGSGDWEVWMNSIFPFLILLNSSGTSLLAQPFQSWGCMAIYSLIASLFTKSHIAECIKNFIWLSIIGRNKQNKNNPRGHSNTVSLVVNSFIGPCNTVVHVFKVPGFSSTVPPYVSSLPRPSSTDTHVVKIPSW